MEFIKNKLKPLYSHNLPKSKEIARKFVTGVLAALLFAGVGIIFSPMGVGLLLSSIGVGLAAAGQFDWAIKQKINASPNEYVAPAPTSSDGISAPALQSMKPAGNDFTAAAEKPAVEAAPQVPAAKPAEPKI